MPRLILRKCAKCPLTNEAAIGIPINSLRGQEILAKIASGEAIVHQCGTQANLVPAPADADGEPVKKTHILDLPGFIITPLNRLINAHWAEAMRMKKADREVISFHANQQKIPKVVFVRSERPRKTGTGKPTKGKLLAGTGPRRRVSLVITLAKGERRYDNDSVQKSTWDSLVACQLLVNDSPNWCASGGDPVWRRGAERGMQIILEDL